MNRNSILPSELPAPQLVHNWQHLYGSSASLAVAELARGEGSDSLLIYVARDTEDAFRVRNEIRFFLGEPGLGAKSQGAESQGAENTIQVLGFPDWETLPYDNFSPHQDIISQRLATLYELPTLNRGVLVVPAQTVMQRLPPVPFIQAQSLVVETGQKFVIADERGRLQRAGYRSVETVQERGEYAVRGALVDIFPMGADLPFRIDLFDDEIESLRTFDPETQRTDQRIDAIRILPAKELPLDEAGVARFRNNWHVTFDVDVRRCPIYRDVSDGIAPPGVEYYLPLFFETTATLFDYFPAKVAVVLAEGMQQTSQAFHADIEARYESLRYDIEHPILTPDRLFLTPDELATSLKRFGCIQLDADAAKHRHRVSFQGRELPDLSANPRGQQQAARLKQFLADCPARVLLTAETPGRRQHLEEFLARSDIRATDFDSFQSFAAGEHKLGLTVTPIDRGMCLSDFVLVTESQIFGRRNDVSTAERRRGVDPELVLRNLTELRVGAPVVHLDHGVGRYAGLETLSIDGHQMEFLALEYADDTRLYVPVTSLHLISRYSGADHAHAPLHRLGSDQWEKAKRRAAEKIHDVAAELLDIFARREAATSIEFAAPDDEYYRFCEQFPFEVTPDQQAAIDAVIEDLCSTKSTDRLICGDVGFGKTEVAMRAAFVAISSGKQVAILVPTTLLAQQHLETFRDRFADWPVQIEAISRLRADGEVADIRSRLERGKVDIVIGTHRLLSPTIRFNDLGLVIVDEEHRFGVRQKEELRKLRAEVDVLALTATPIPRTLNMALHGMRDLSIIATPPAKRLSIKTFVMERRRQVIKEAIARELARGGQVFYLHNQVDSIDRVADELADLVPAARIGVGHGQMAKRKLETVMADFYHRRCNLLVCTTIIETGIDIPNANTIIIDRADRFGLAQLHQLRGRVGRSHRQAYAYLMTPEPRAMNADARKRLDAIEAAGELGIGFTLATHDLEIRGAGELLGDDQSGQIETIGFSLYMEMLERAVEAIKSGRTPNLEQPLQTTHEVNLHVPALIPDDYLPDVHTRLIMYKRIANAASMDELDDLKVEMIDRFGLLPEQLRNLFRTTEIKLSVSDLGIVRVDVGESSGRIEFDSNTRVDPLALVRMVQREPGTYRLQDATKLRVTRNLQKTDVRFQFVEALIADLTPDTDLAQSA